MEDSSLPSLPKDLKDIPKDKQELLTLGFSLSVHVLRSFYYEIINRLKFIDEAKHDKVKEFEKRLDEMLPILEPGGFHIHLNKKEYSMLYKPIKDINKYDLNLEINKIPNLGKLPEEDKQKILKEIDICASSIPSVNNQLIRRKDFQKLIKDIFDIFDDTLPKEKADEQKDIDLKVMENQRIYYIYENGVHFGIHIDSL